MKAEDKLQIQKFLLMLVNSLFVVLGVSLFGCSAWILFDKNNFIMVLSDEDDLKVVAGGLFVIGLVVLGVSILGCFGIHLENRCFIVFYIGFLVAIVLGQLFVTFLLLLKRNQIQVVLTETIDAIITHYGDNTTQATRRLLDSMQHSGMCCGRKNASDWQMNILIQNLSMSHVYPCSCFNSTCPVILSSETYRFGNGQDIYITGCGVKLEEWFTVNILVIVGMDIGLLAIQILQFALGIHIYRNIGHKIKTHHSKKLLNAEEESPAPESDLHQSDQDDHQPHSDTYDQQPYPQEYAEQSNQYEQHYHDHHDLQANGQPYDHQHNVYAQDDPGQAYDQHQHQHYHHDPEPTGHIYDHRQDNAYDQEYAGYGDEYYQHGNEQDHPQAYNGNYNQGYVQDYDSGNNYDCY